MSGDTRQERKTPAGSRLHFDTDNVRVTTPMRPADWPVARSLQGISAQTGTKDERSQLQEHQK